MDNSMEQRGLTYSEIQEIPDKSLVLLTGLPGAGKSTFCHQVVLNSLAAERPIIFVTTEQSPNGILSALREKGMTQESGLSFVDAFTDTVGMTCRSESFMICANCADLNSITIAITKTQERTIKEGNLLVLDSLTSPYLLCGLEVVKFIRLFLSKFALEGNSVLALVDEGCGKEEDVVAMASVADGIIKMEVKDSSRTINVVKHPRVRPTRIEVPTDLKRTELGDRIFDWNAAKKLLQVMALGGETAMRKGVGDYMNLFWPNLAHWSGMLWDPKRFPIMTYEFNREDAPSMIELFKEDKKARNAYFSWRMRLIIKLFLPKNFSKVKDMKKARFIQGLARERTGTMEYLKDVSKTDEHYIRVHESSDCCGFENVGVAMASYLPPLIAGMCKGFEYWKGLERDWNAIETKCIGLGDPYCEFKLVPGEIDGLKDSLEKDSSVVERIHERLMDRLMGFLLHGKPLVNRPGLGSDIYMHAVGHTMGFPHLAGERYQMALRMGGAKAGKVVGERLTDAELSEDEAVKRMLKFLEHCKVGKVIAGDTIKIMENCESAYTKVFTTKWKEPSCYFTTGFLNGFFSTVKNQHVREKKCIAVGDPYCEWEFR